MCLVEIVFHMLNLHPVPRCDKQFGPVSCELGSSVTGNHERKH